MKFSFAAIVVSLLCLMPVGAQRALNHYIFFGSDRQQVKETAAVHQPFIAGAQISYSWRILEPTKDTYKFSSIEEDLDWLQQRGKRLFVQLQDVSFDEATVNVPDYLRSSAFDGGADRQYSFADDNDRWALPAGWVSRRWDSKVSSRYFLLLSELGKRFDGKIAGINLPETAVDFGSTGKYYPSGFTPPKYRDAVKSYMRAAKEAFGHSIVIQYANFMPGEWLPSDDEGYLKSVYEYGKAIGVGLGGPDLQVYKKAQMDHGYALLPLASSTVPTGIAVQFGNYAEINPRTGRVVTIDEIYRFGRDVLKVNYFFWSTEEPYFNRDLIPYLEGINGK